jgi:hypothetical protein
MSDARPIQAVIHTTCWDQLADSVLSRQQTYTAQLMATQRADSKQQEENGITNLRRA